MRSEGKGSEIQKQHAEDHEKRNYGNLKEVKDEQFAWGRENASQSGLELGTADCGWHYIPGQMSV